MAYRHDVFISYKRETNWTPWARDHFKPLLKSYLQQELTYEPRIFVDEHIEVGADWVEDLAEHLAKSKILIAIFSGDYFGSDWCLSELDLMLGRSFKHTPRGQNKARLIVPVVVHDGDLIPTEVTRIKPHDLKPYRIACMNNTTTLYQDFSAALGKLAPFIKSALDASPPYNEAWLKPCQDRFNEVFQAQAAGLIIPPVNFKSKPRPTLLVPPRIGVS